ncbi:hypothetical protein TNCV_4992031 [Trichonephila clavipes]|nr:hypothetical protein TNCV_4992031 [Trichonephila clavipes]
MQLKIHPVMVLRYVKSVEVRFSGCYGVEVWMGSARLGVILVTWPCFKISRSSIRRRKLWQWGTETAENRIGMQRHKCRSSELWCKETEKEQKQQHINGIENILLKGCTTTGA